MSINKVTLLGTVCSEYKVTTFADGGKNISFDLVTGERAYVTRDGRNIPEHSEFHKIIVKKGGQVKLIENNLKKKDRLLVIGEIRYRKYNDKQNVERYITEIIAEEVQLIDYHNGQEQSAPQQQTKQQLSPQMQANIEKLKTNGFEPLQF